jgi:hypothetical protein
MFKSVPFGATALGGIPVQFVIASGLLVVMALALAVAVFRTARER